MRVGLLNSSRREGGDDSGFDENWNCLFMYDLYVIYIDYRGVE